MQNGITNHLIALISDNYIVIGHFTVRSKARLFEVYIEIIGFRIISKPQRMLWSFVYRRNQFQIFLDVAYGHNCFLFARDRIRRVKNAVITKPSSSISRYTTTKNLLASTGAKRVA